MLRTFVTAALLLTATPAVAQTVPLPSGKPAGVREAQAVNTNATVVGAFIAILGLGVYFITTDYPPTATVSPEP
jgi:hypothetical protein